MSTADRLAGSNSPEMSAPTFEDHHGERGHGWSLWVRQVLSILRIELRKTVLGRRSIPVYALAGIPIFVCAIIAIVSGPEGEPIAGNLGQARQIYSVIYLALVLGMVIFFGCAGIFTNLFRGEVLDRSLHYYLLSPLRREVLVVGKYLSGLLVTVVLFSVTTVISFLLMYVPFGLTAGMEDFFGGPGIGQLFNYLGVTALACLGYGAVFLILGLVFRNPILPVGALLAWEFWHFLLPPTLKKLSVIHYLKGLVPIPATEGPLAIVSEPPPAWLSVAGLLGLTVLALVLAAAYLRRAEIRYSED